MTRRPASRADDHSGTMITPLRREMTRSYWRQVTVRLLRYRIRPREQVIHSLPDQRLRISRNLGTAVTKRATSSPAAITQTTTTALTSVNATAPKAMTAAHR